jgi:hypothetical protein
MSSFPKLISCITTEARLVTFIPDVVGIKNQSALPISRQLRRPDLYTAAAAQLDQTEQPWSIAPNLRPKLVEQQQSTP